MRSWVTLPVSHLKDLFPSSSFPEVHWFSMLFLLSTETGNSPSSLLPDAPEAPSFLCLTEGQKAPSVFLVTVKKFPQTNHKHRSGQENGRILHELGTEATHRKGQALSKHNEWKMGGGTGGKGRICTCLHCSKILNILIKKGKTM